VSLQTMKVLNALPPLTVITSEHARATEAPST
jgi:hypothetical protein